MADDSQHDAPNSEKLPVNPSKIRSWLELLFLVSAGRKNGRLVFGIPGQEKELLVLDGFIESIELSQKPGVVSHLLTGIRRPLDKKIHAMAEEVRLDSIRLVAELESTGAMGREEVTSVFTHHALNFLLDFRGTDEETFVFHPLEVPQSQDETSSCHGLHVQLEPVFFEVFMRTKAYDQAEGILPNKETVVIRTGSKISLHSAEVQQSLHRMSNGERSLGEMNAELQLDPLLFTFHVLTLRARGLVIEAGPDRLAALAGKAMAEGRLDLAIRFYEKAKNCGATSPDIFRELGRIYEIMGRKDKAAENHLMFARHCLEQSEQDQAAELFQKVLSVEPACLEALTFSIEYCLKRGDKERAAQHCDNLIPAAVDAGDWNLANRGRKLLIEGGAASEQLFDEFFDGVRRVNDRDKAVSELRFLYTHLLKAGYQERAREVLGRLLAIDGGLLEERFDLAQLLLESGRFDDARRELTSLQENLIQAEPPEETPRWELLKKVCEVLVRVEPDNRSSRCWLAQGARLCLEADSAKEHLDWVVNDFNSRGEHSELADILQRIATREPDSVEVLSLLSHALEKASRGEEAVRFHLEFGERAQHRGSVESAAKSYEEVLRLDPMHVGARARLVRLRQEQNDVPGTIRHLHRLASAQAGRGAFEEALESYSELCRLCPGEVFFFQCCTDLNEWAGNEDAFRSSLAEVGRVAIRGENVGIARATVQRLRAHCTTHPAIEEIEAGISSVLQERGAKRVETNHVAEKAVESSDDGFPSVAGTEGSKEGTTTPSKTEEREPELATVAAPQVEVNVDGAPKAAGDFSSIVEALKAAQTGEKSDSEPEEPTPPSTPAPGAKSRGPVGFRPESNEDSIAGILSNLKSMNDK